MDEDRFSFALGGEGDRSFESAVDKRRSTEDKLPGEDESSFDNLESKGGSSEVVGTFFKI